MITNTTPGADEDFDGDGVGDLCDPAPRQSGDCLALFDAFQGTSPLSSHWRSSGAKLAKTSNQMVIPPGAETIVYLDREFPLTSLTVSGYIPGGSGARRSIQLMFDHERLGGVTGLACGVDGEDQAGSTSQVSLVDIEKAAENERLSSKLNDIPVGAGTTATIGWNDTDPETGESFAASCHGALYDQQDNSDNTGFVARPPTGGAFALRTRTVGFNVSYLIGYGRNCVAP